MTETIFNYVLKNFEAVYKVEQGKFNISYGLDGKSQIQIKQGNVNYFNSKEQFDTGEVIWKEWDGEMLPFLFDRDSSSSVITGSGSQIIINFDIIASSFFFLSNWQEYVCPVTDHYGRFIIAESIQYKLGFITRPVVNYYFDILKTAIQRAYGINLINALWNGKKMAVCLTHDIDLCQSAWLQGSFREVLKGNILSPFRLVAARLLAEDKWFNFNEIIEVERRFGANSTFFFLPHRGKINGIPNADYNITDSKFKKVFREIENSGSEVGIHGSIGTCSDSEHLSSEISRIQNKVTGNRFHFLMYNSLLSPSVLSESDLQYDSTLGFAENIGFRNSYCLPFYLFDIKNNKSTDVLEIPLTVMDVSFSELYMAVKPDEAAGKVFDIIKEIEKFNGCLTLLWHNTYFSKYKFTGWKNVYIKILEHCSGRGSLITSGRNIYSMFTSKGD